MKFFSLTVLLSDLLFTACKKQDTNVPGNETQVMDNTGMNGDEEFRQSHERHSPKTWLELQQARAATARYQDINNAFKDGYADINVVMPNMGYHFMKAGLVDAKFEIRKPELLVYNKDENDKFQLVAVEYAVPLDQSPDAPEGFFGNDDVWNRDTTFGLWTLHAWGWKHNPDGVFNPTNPLVHVR
jgi:hypothetical protein